MRVIGRFEVYARNVWTGLLRPVTAMSNTVLYSGYDLIAQAMAGERCINGMYLEYTDSTVPSTAIPKDRTRAYYAALTGHYGYCRLATVATPVFTASGADYAGNIVSFMAETDGSSAGGLPFTDGVKVYALALASMPDIAIPANDMIYNGAYLEAGGSNIYVTKAANIQIAIKGRIKFED